MNAIEGKIVRIGNSSGIILKKKYMDQLHLKKGEVINFIICTEVRT